MRKPNYGNLAFIYCRSGARSGATRKSGGAERSGKRALQKNDGAERSGARSGGSRSGNGAGSGGYRIRLERGAAFLPAPLRSHALDGATRADYQTGRKIGDRILSVAEPGAWSGIGCRVT